MYTHGHDKPRCAEAALRPVPALKNTKAPLLCQHQRPPPPAAPAIAGNTSPQIMRLRSQHPTPYTRPPLRLIPPPQKHATYQQALAEQGGGPS